jgi:uncharacterized damage-inducible protein DinB
MNPPQFPAGPHTPEPNPSPARRAELVAELEQLPSVARAAVAGLTREQLDTRYRNWTVRQIIHHLADSHMNAFLRFRWALTEDNPTIKPYDETLWSELPETRTADVEMSLKLLDGLHARWAALIRSMSEADRARTYFHPQYQKTTSLAEALGMYAHHGRHHLGQVRWLRQANGW